MNAISIEDRITGAIFGTAVGDALGYPVEFSSGVTVRDLLPPYQISDDTQMTIATVEGVLKTDPTPGKDLPGLEENIAAELVKWNESQDIPANRRAPGNTCLTSTARLRKGVSWRESGVHSAGCGTTMRMGILGLLLTEEEIIERAPGIAAMTHTDPRAIAGGVGAALVCRAVFQGASVMNALELVENYLRDPAYTYSCAEIVGLVCKVRGLSNMEPPEGWFYEGPHVVVETLGEGWVADECLALALILAIWAGDSFEKAVLGAANLDRADKDSVGAVAGCIAGAALGISAISEEWIKHVEGSDKMASLTSKVIAWQTVHIPS